MSTGPHFRDIAGLRTAAMTPTITRAAVDGENPLWFSQQDAATIQIAANVIFAGQGPSEHAKRNAELLKVASEEGWRMTHYRTAGYGGVRVLEKEGKVLTAAGADALLTGEFAKIAYIDTGDDDADFSLYRQRCSEQLARWMATLPESTLNHAPSFTAKINHSLLSEQYSFVYDNQQAGQYLSFRNKNGRIIAHEGGHDALLRIIVGISRAEPSTHWAVATRDAEAKAKAHAATGLHEFLRQHGYTPMSTPTETTTPTPASSMSIADLFVFRKKLAAGEVTADDVLKTWTQWKGSKEAVLAELGKMKKDELKRFAGFHFGSEKKEGLVRSSYSNLSFTFVAGSSLSYGETIMGGGGLSQEQATDAQMGKWTDEYIQSQAAERRAKLEAKQKSVLNPETLEEFDFFVNYHGRHKLSAEDVTALKRMNAHDQGQWIEARGESKLNSERAKYDELRAKAGRKVREVQAAVRKEVQATALPNGVTMGLTETKHTQKGHPLWVVRLSDRVDGDLFKQLSIRAKQLGGYYSSYARDGAVPGFQFESPEKASVFMSLDRVDGAVRLEEQRADQQERASERLAAVGERMVERGEDSLNADRKTNTARRAAMASSVEASARREIQLGQTAVNLSTMIAAGKVEFLDRVNTATKLETLEDLLSRAQCNRITALEKDGGFGFSSRYVSWEKERAKPFALEDIDHAKFPWPSFDTSDLLSAVAQGERQDGAKLASVRVRRLLGTRPPGQDRFECRDHHEVEILRELADRLGRDRLKDRFFRYDHLKSMNIHSAVELRASLREYLTHRETLQNADPVKLAERELIGLPIPGFFPTPELLGDEVVRRADIKPGMRVLEPECGKADLVDAIKRACPEAQVDAVEVSSRLIDFLDKKGVPLVHRGDFLEFNPGPVYDRIVMNPPFEGGQDIAHVQHAYDLLAPGGKLVAIMSEGPFFRADKASEGFREMLTQLDGSSERCPEGAFAGADAFRQTGVQTRIVELSRAAERVEVGTGQPDFATSRIGL